jgi:hypothetical protein
MTSPDDEIRAPSPSPVAGEDEIVEAMAREVYNHWQFQAQVRWVEGGNSIKQGEARDYARAALAAARPLIIRAARAEADAEIAELRASLAKAEEALEPFSKRLFHEKHLSDEQVIECETRNECRQIELRVSDFRRAAALSDLRKARGAARIAELTPDLGEKQ